MSEPIRILIVDDNEDDREHYRRALNKASDAHYDIAEAEDGEGGLSLIGENPPDCVLLDYSLPGRNGIEVLKRLRGKYSFVPVVMLTGQGNEAVAVSAMQEGAQNYISKSTITPESIQRAIRVAIEHCSMEKRIHEQRTSLEIFTHALAHDLKEPVRTIKSFLDLLGAHEKLTDKGLGYFNFLQSASDRMAQLIDAVYFYTRLDGAPQEIAKEPCDASAVLAEVKENIGNLISDRNVLITSTTLPHVNANRLQLMQVLQNLVCNAIHHCEVQPAIRVDARDEGNHWLFRVIDNGPGIDEAQRDKVFAPFKRLARNKDRGLGLGLAICRRVVESHGGKIWFEAGPEGGTAFLFTLPKETGPAAQTIADTRPAQDTTPSDAKHLANILLVEDNEADIELARIMLLEEDGLRCNLLVARDAREAMTMMRAGQDAAALVDLILLDINMPGMDGLELLGRMRSEDGFPQIPVVMCTTSVYDKDMDRAKSLGALGYITKPAALSKLKPVLQKVLSLCLRQDGDGHILLRAA